MAQTPGKQATPEKDERDALIKSAVIVGHFTPAAHTGDNSPMIREMQDARREVENLRMSLLHAGRSPFEVLAAVEEWAAKRPLPLTDASRKARSLETTFGQAVLDRVNG